MFTRRQIMKSIGGAPISLGLLPQIPAYAQSRELHIGWQKYGVLALAKSAGLLERQLAHRNISVSWFEFSSGPPLVEALGSASADIGPTGDVPPLFAQASGRDLKYIGTYRGSPQGKAILVHANSNIYNLRDLKGKKLGFQRGSTIHNLVIKALQSEQVSASEIELIDIAPPDGFAAFKNGNLDAWAIWDPYAAVAEADPNVRVLITAEGIVNSWSFFLANGNFVQTNADIIPEILGVLADVGRAAQSNLEETVKKLAQITGIPEGPTRVSLTRKGFDLGAVSTVSNEAIQYQQSLADQLYKLQILPRRIEVEKMVWRPDQE